MKRKAVATKILVALVLALSLAVVLSLLLTQGTIDTRERLGNASDEFQNATEKQKEGLIERVTNSIRNGAAAAGLIEQDDTS